MVVRLAGLMLILALAGCSTTSPVMRDPAAQSSGEMTGVAAALEAQYREWAGVPYREGGQNRRGIDCSAFVQLTLSERLGIAVPRTTSAQSRTGRPVAAAELTPGDLVFFRTGKGPHGNHVGIYAGDGQFLHASSSQGVTMSRLDNPYWSRTYRQARRVATY